MIDIEQLGAVCRDAGANLTPDVRLSELTTFKIGGPCAALVTLPDEPIVCLPHRVSARIVE